MQINLKERYVSTALLFYERDGVGYTGMLMQKR